MDASEDLKEEDSCTAVETEKQTCTVEPSAGVEEIGHSPVQNAEGKRYTNNISKLEFFLNLNVYYKMTLSFVLSCLSLVSNA